MQDNFRLDSPLSIHITRDPATGLVARAHFELSAPIIALDEDAQGFPPFRMTLEGVLPPVEVDRLAEHAVRAFVAAAKNQMILARIPLFPLPQGCAEHPCAGAVASPVKTTAPKKRARRARGVRS